MVQREPQAAAQYRENFPGRLPADDGAHSQRAGGERRQLAGGRGAPAERLGGGPRPPGGAGNDARWGADGAHALKGWVGNFGPTAALDTIREMEKIARQGKLDGAWELYATLEDEIALLLPALHAIGAQKKPLRRTGRSHHAPGRKR